MRHERPAQLAKRRFILISASSICAALAMAVLLVNLVFMTIRTDQQLLLDELLDYFDGVFQEVNTVLESLEAADYNECNDAAILNMRQWVFRSEYIKDIAYLDNSKITCTTGVGIIEPKNDATLPEPTFTSQSGIDVWVNHFLTILIFGDQPVSVTIARRGHYSIIFMPANFSEINRWNFPWELVNTTLKPGSIIHIRGSNGLWQANSGVPLLMPSLKKNISQCSSYNPGYCATAGVSLETLAKTYELYWFLAGFLCLFSAAAGGEITRRYLNYYYALPARIKRGLRAGYFFWLYQPVVELNTGAIIGCEALARFDDGLDDIQPTQFIPILREQHSSWPFTELMVKTVMQNLAEHPDLPDNFNISFNIFPQDIVNENVLSLVDNESLKGSRFTIGLEITEDEYLEHGSAQQVLNTLAHVGYSLLIDDFGAGYSNLRLVESLDCHIVKIDRSFVREIEAENVKSSVIPHVVEMAKQFGLKVVAEGVETASQAAVLKRLGVDYGQGWQLGKPSTLSELIKLIKTQNLLQSAR